MFIVGLASKIITASFNSKVHRQGVIGLAVCRFERCLNHLFTESISVSQIRSISSKCPRPGSNPSPPESPSFCPTPTSIPRPLPSTSIQKHLVQEKKHHTQEKKNRAQEKTNPMRRRNKNPMRRINRNPMRRINKKMCSFEIETLES